MWQDDRAGGRSVLTVQVGEHADVGAGGSGAAGTYVAANDRTRFHGGRWEYCDWIQIGQHAAAVR